MRQLSYVLIEHMEQDEESTTPLPPWVGLEYAVRIPILVPFIFSTNLIHLK